MTTNHSPTPWRVGSGMPRPGDDKIIYTHPEGTMPGSLAKVAVMDDNYFNSQVAAANAAFIVRAVNSHEAIRKALKDVCAEWERGDKHHEISYLEAFRHAYLIAKTALALTKEAPHAQ